MYSKMKCMQTLLTMLDNTQRDFYHLENEMPQINIHNPKNLNEILNLS